MTSPNNNIKKLTEIVNRASRSAIAVVDALAQRGAIKGEEMLAVGQLREQLAQMIQLAELIESETIEETQQQKK